MRFANELDAAEKFFHAQIPLTRAMGLQVLADAAHGFVLEAPVAPNRNHLQTAFGGSINAVATLAAYGLLWLELRGTSARLVLAESTIRFIRPVEERIRAFCIPPTAAEWEAFHAKLRKECRARIRLKVHVEEQGEIAAAFQGHFVATSGPAPD
ncbi:MAG: YiiD C-terminal domain-containing protein [Chthoniobacterales bacterium]